MIALMKRQSFSGALTFGIAVGAMVLTSCSTIESRISEILNFIETFLRGTRRW